MLKSKINFLIIYAVQIINSFFKVFNLIARWLNKNLNNLNKPVLINENKYFFL